MNSQSWVAPFQVVLVEMHPAVFFLATLGMGPCAAADDEISPSFVYPAALHLAAVALVVASLVVLCSDAAVFLSAAVAVPTRHVLWAAAALATHDVHLDADVPDSHDLVPAVVDLDAVARAPSAFPTDPTRPIRNDADLAANAVAVGPAPVVLPTHHICPVELALAFRDGAPAADIPATHAGVPAEVVLVAIARAPSAFPAGPTRTIRDGGDLAAVVAAAIAVAIDGHAMKFATCS